MTHNYRFIRSIVLATTAAVALTVGAAGSVAASPSPSPAADKRPAPSASTSAAKSGTTIRVRKSSRYGRYLTDGRGLTLYLFTRDKGKPKSTCFGACEKAWPIVTGKPKAGTGVTAKLGTTKRKDGRTQATYNGHPLYYYVDETKAGEIFCQDVVEFGGTWLIIAPSGKAIR